MQILIFTLLILGLILFTIYKIKKSFSKKELLTFSVIVIAIIISFIYYNNKVENRLPIAFKKFYLEHKNIQIEKLSYLKTNIEVLKSSKNIYNFNYIFTKENKEYFCEAKDIEVIQIEDEFIFKNFKEDCKIK